MFLKCSALVVGISLGVVYLSGMVAKPNRASELFPSSDVAQNPAGAREAIFAGGCFWCMEAPFDKADGVLDTKVGYIGGHKKNPTYEEVSSGSTGHTEAVRVLYDPKKISYQSLLKLFWRNIDPTAANRQFCDVGTQYRSGIFYKNEEQKRLANESKNALLATKKLSADIVTEITKADTFYLAEEYHQDFYRKNPSRYKSYRQGCGRDRRLRELWD